MPSVEGDRLYGHGVQNMKGGLATIVLAAEAIRRSEVQLKGDLVVACVVGETQGGEGTYHLMQSGLRPCGWRESRRRSTGHPGGPTVTTTR